MNIANSNNQQSKRSLDSHDDSGKKFKKILTEEEKLFSDLESVEHAITSLGRALHTIFRCTPSIEKYEKNPTVDLKLHSKKVMLARYIIKQKKQGNLGLFGDLKAVLNDEVPKPQIIPNPRVSLDEEKKSFDVYCKDQIKKYMSGDGSKMLEFTTGGEAWTWPPPLPPIPDFNIRHTVFTHKSMGTLYHASNPSNQLEVHNERYEFLGDSIVNMMFAIIACEKLPTVSDGDLTAFRRQLISNNTLAQWSELYGLDQNLRITPQFIKSNKYSVGGTNRNKDTPKYVADVFEAYVGGLWLFHLKNDGIEKTFKIVKNWFERLSQPFFDTVLEAANLQPAPKEKKAEENQLRSNPTQKAAYKDKNQSSESEKNNNSSLNSNKSKSTGLEFLSNRVNDYASLLDNRVPDKDAKLKLYNKIGNAAIKITYEAIGTDSKGWYTVACKIGDEVLGTGKGKNKVDAGCFAAMSVLDNNDLIYEYSMKRRSLPFKGKSEDQRVSESNDHKIQDGEDSDDAIIIGVSKCNPSSSEDTVDKDSVIITDETKSPQNTDKTENTLKSDLKETKLEKNGALVLSIAQERALQPETIKNYMSDPINTLSKFLKPIQNRIDYKFEKKENRWVCSLLVDEKVIETADGSSKKRAKKRMALYSLLTDHQVLNKYLEGTGSSIP